MRAYLTRRIGHTLLVIWVVLSLIFIMFRLLPGDPTSMMVDQNLDEAARQHLLEDWGLTGSLWQQYFAYLINVVQFKFGDSFFYRMPVWQAIGSNWWNTVVLMGAAMVIALFSGVVIGAYLGWRRGSGAERAGVVLALVLRSTPIFWLGILFLMVFAYWLQVFPTGGMRSTGQSSASLLETYLSWDFAFHMVLPLFTASLYYFADPMMVMRTCMLEVKGEDFIDYLEALGLPERRRIWHCGRNAILPVATFTSVMVGFVFGGQVMLETVFSWPGIGREMVLAIERRDYPIAQASFLIIAVVTIAMNFVVDMLYFALDPRIRHE